MFWCKQPNPARLGLVVGFAQPASKAHRVHVSFAIVVSLHLHTHQLLPRTIPLKRRAFEA
jgi:hypothetical protein